MSDSPSANDLIFTKHLGFRTAMSLAECKQKIADYDPDYVGKSVEGALSSPLGNLASIATGTASANTSQDFAESTISTDNQLSIRYGRDDASVAIYAVGKLRVVDDGVDIDMTLGIQRSSILWTFVGLLVVVGIVIGIGVAMDALGVGILIGVGIVLIYLFTQLMGIPKARDQFADDMRNLLKQ